jgi:hypothetical protein
MMLKGIRKPNLAQVRPFSQRQKHHLSHPLFRFARSPDHDQILDNPGDGFTLMRDKHARHRHPRRDPLGCVSRHGVDIMRNNHKSRSRRIFQDLLIRAIRHPDLPQAVKLDSWFPANHPQQNRLRQIMGWPGVVAGSCRLPCLVQSQPTQPLDHRPGIPLTFCPQLFSSHALLPQVLIQFPPMPQIIGDRPVNLLQAELWKISLNLLRRFPPPKRNHHRIRRNPRSRHAPHALPIHGDIGIALLSIRASPIILSWDYPWQINALS